MNNFIRGFEFQKFKNSPSTKNNKKNLNYEKSIGTGKPGEKPVEWNKKDKGKRNVILKKLEIAKLIYCTEVIVQVSVVIECKVICSIIISKCAQEVVIATNNYQE